MRVIESNGKSEKQVKFSASKIGHFEKLTTSKTITPKMSELEIEHFEKGVTSKDQSAKCVTSKLVTSKLTALINESLR